MSRGRDRRRADRRKGGQPPPRPRRIPAPSATAVDDELLQQPLLQGLDEALAQPHPLNLLMFASGIVELAEPDPLAAARASVASAAPADQIDLAELIESFLSVGLRQTDGLLLVMKELIGDELLRRRIRTTVAERKRPVPSWLVRLDQVRPTRAVELSHILRDGENIVLGVELPGGRPLTALVYVDHNMGTVVKDAFALDVPIDEVLGRLHEIDDFHDDDTSIREMPLADARARIAQAIEFGRHFLEPLDTDTWPMSRPLVEWMLRLMPEGGIGYPDPDWTQQDIDAIAERFLASKHGASFDDDRRDILDHLLWFGAEYAPGDPLRVSPVSVKLVLLDRAPRKIVADAEYLGQVPDVLRALTRFAHESREVPPHLTRETLAAIDSFEPEYRTIIRRPRHQGAMALLERMGAVAPLDSDDGDGVEGGDAHVFPDGETIEEYFLRLWAREVGGVEALRRLDASPLPVEDLDLSTVADNIRDVVAHIGRLVAEVCAELFDDEFRTVCFRVLSRVAAADPKIFRRAGRTETAAAAVIWIASKNNGMIGTYGGITVKQIMAQLGLNGTPGQRALPMLKALDVERPYDWTIDPVLGDPQLLTSHHRQWILESRESLSASFELE